MRSEISYLICHRYVFTATFSLAIIAVMIGVMQVSAVSAVSDQEEHSIPIKAMQYIGQLIFVIQIDCRYFWQTTETI